MPLNTVVLAGAKAFKARLHVRRISNKVIRLGRELRSAQQAEAAAKSKLQALQFRLNADAAQIADGLWDAYFADAD